MMTAGAWRVLATRSVLMAVMADWLVLLGPDYDWFKVYLEPTSIQGLDYRCMCRVICGCRHLIALVKGIGLQAICQCGIGECKALTLTHAQVLLHAVARERLVADVLQALGFGPARSGPGLYAGPHVRLVGTYRGAPVYLALCLSETELLAGLSLVASGYGQPFILLAPTVDLRSKTVEAVLEGQRSIYITLAACLGANGEGSLQLRCSIEKELRRFRAGLAVAPEATAEEKPARNKSSGNRGRLRYENDFLDLWLGAEFYNLRKRTKARLCIQYLFENGAFDKTSACHFEKEIDPYVREHSKLERLPPNAERKFHHYFNSGTGKLAQLYRELIESAGRGSGRFFLNVR